MLLVNDILRDKIDVENRKCPSKRKFIEVVRFERTQPFSN